MNHTCTHFCILTVFEVIKQRGILNINLASNNQSGGSDFCIYAQLHPQAQGSLFAAF
jgi:hypothetical protein